MPDVERAVRNGQMLALHLALPSRLPRQRIEAHDGSPSHGHIHGTIRHCRGYAAWCRPYGCTGRGIQRIERYRLTKPRLDIHEIASGDRRVTTLPDKSGSF